MKYIKQDCGCVHGIDEKGRESIVNFCTQCEDLFQARHQASAAERQQARDDLYLKRRPAK